MSKCDCCKEEHDNLIEYRGYKMCPACYMSYVNKIKVCENNAKYENEIDQLKQQLDEKDEQINNLEQMCQICNKEQENELLKQQLAEKDKKIELLNAMISTLPEHDKEIKEYELEKVKDLLQF